MNRPSALPALTVVAALAAALFALAPARATASPRASAAPRATASPRAPAAPPSAGDAARTHFDRGVRLFQEGEHGAALVEFRRAYAAVPNYRVQYNVARTCLELKDDACALGAFERYLAEGEGQVERGRRAAVERELERLRMRVGYVEVSVSAPGADVSIDDVPVGTSPIAAALPVDAGRHRVAASLPSGPSAYRFIEIAGGEHLRVELGLPEPARAALASPPAPAAPLPRPAPARPPAPARTGFWVGVAATSAFAAGAGALGYTAYRTHGELDAALRSPAADAGRVEHYRVQGRALSLAADVSTAVAAVAGALTLYVALSPERAKGPPAAGALWLHVGAPGASLRYAF